MWGRVHLNLCNFELYLMYPQGYYSFPLHKSVVPTVIEFRSPSGLLVSAPCIRHVDPSSLSAICFSGLSGQKQRYCYTRMYVPCYLIPEYYFTTCSLLLYVSYVQSNFYQPTNFFLVDFCQKLPEEKGEKKSKFVKVEERKWWSLVNNICQVLHTHSFNSLTKRNERKK